jgi:phosphoenolpyruvate synthase/pyruvate phosphate dikinase
MSLADLANEIPLIATELEDVMAKLEKHYRDLCDIEFTVEKGKLWILQTRVGKRTAEAAFRIAVTLVEEGKITIDEINKLYKEVIKKTNPKNIMIKVCAIDGFKTLKSFDYIENDLSFVYEDYYSSLSKETKEKFDSLLAVQFIIKP